MKILVLGATGPVGGYVTRLALDRGYDVRLFVRNAAKAKGDGLDQSGSEILEGSLDRLYSALQSARHCDAIISCLPLAFAPRVIRIAKWNGIKRVVLFSSTRLFSSVPCPSVDMVKNGEEKVMASGLDWTLLRPTMVVDYPNDQNVSKLSKLITKYPVLPVPGNGRQLVQPVSVQDCARASIDCLEKEKTIGKALTLAGGEVLEYREMLEHITNATGGRSRFVSVPLKPFSILARVFPFLFNSVGIERAMIERMAEDKNFPIEETEKLLGWKMTPFRGMPGMKTDQNPGTSNYEKFRTGNPVVQKLFEGFFGKLRTVMEKEKPGSVLDAGCGEGETIARLHDLLPDITVGFDLNPESVAFTQQRHQTASITVENIYELPYGDRQFEMVMCCEVLEHLDHPEKALSELNRVVGKTLLLTVPWEPWFQVGSLMRGKHLTRLGNHPEHMNHWNPETFEKFLGQHFHDVNVSTSFPWLVAVCRK